MLEKLKQILLTLLEILKPRTAVNLPNERATITPIVSPDIVSPEIAPIVNLPISSSNLPKYDWSTRESTRHSCRVICDEEGLTNDEKTLIAAVIHGESDFDIYSKNENKKNGVVLSTDWGICQINDYYHIGLHKDFPSVQYVLDNPDACVRWMIKMYRAGLLKMWCAYSNNSYKQWLQVESHP